MADPSNLSESQLAQIFAPPGLGILGRTDYAKLEAGCQRLIDYYLKTGHHTAPALTLAIVCKQLIQDLRAMKDDLHG